MSLFEWDEQKNLSNQRKHHVSFEVAALAFADERRLVFEDASHSTRNEKRYFCVGVAGAGILTVRFTRRGGKIRIFGAAYWRKGKKIYEETYSV